MKKRTVYIGKMKLEMEYGKEYFINGKIYAICSECGKLIRLNKPVFGSLHICE